MARQIINPKQTQAKVYVEYPGDYALGHKVQPGTPNYIGDHKILFDKVNGYHFSDDKNMDRVVEYFVKKKGFKVVGKKKAATKKVETKE